MVNNCRAGRLTVRFALRLTVSKPGRDMDSFAFIIHPLEGRFEDYTVGRDIPLERVREITAISEKHGFDMSSFRSYRVRSK